MKLIRNLGVRQMGGYTKMFSLFKCQLCGDKVVRVRQVGINGKSCGCLKRERMCELNDSLLHGVWATMKTRCLNINSPKYKWYGARGISVCDSWLEFKPFYAWAQANGYKEGLELDRRDNDGNYEPENCRFVTHTTNVQNSRLAKLNMEKANEIRLICKKGLLRRIVVAEMYGVSVSTIKDILRNRTWRCHDL